MGASPGCDGRDQRTDARYLAAELFWIDRSEFEGNTSLFARGGGIAAFGTSSLAVTNAGFAHNAAWDSGGAIAIVSQGEPNIIRHRTFFANTAEASGQSVAIDWDVAAPHVIANICDSLRLVDTSPARDTVPNALCVPSDLDIELNSRPDQPGGLCDMGFFEVP